MSTVIKPSNPKDALGSKKLPVHLVPDTMVVFASLGFLEGALKYGQFNWRVAGVRVSIYIAALERHKMKFMSGEWADPGTGVPHLSSMMCCLAIITDAFMQGKLVDDRPPAQPGLSHFVDALERNVADLKLTFKGHDPIQYTQQWVEDDSRRQSKSSSGQAAEAAPGVLLEARSERHGRARRGLPRKPQRVRVSNRNKNSR